MKGRLYICRHGETSWTISGRHTGTTDLLLTEKGKEESKALGERLKKCSFEKVFVSPLKRALETCQIAGCFPGAEIDPDLVEWKYGKYEGLTHDEIMAIDPTWNIFLKGGPGGESVQEVCERADRFLKRLARIPGDVCIFSSGHISRLIATRWLNLPPSAGNLFSLFPASFSLLGYERDSRAMITWNDVSHLTNLMH